MQRSSCHPSGAHNFKVVPRFLKNLCTPFEDEEFWFKIMIHSLFYFVLTVHLDTSV